MLHNTKFKQGAASFYIVAIATLILVIMATSFAAIIMSEIARTSNDDLAQSAYDSALAGIEDAKLAYYEYSKCVAGAEDASPNCESIKTAFNSKECNSVAQILYNTDGEIKLQESTEGDSSMDQAYTCVKFYSRTDYTNEFHSSSSGTSSSAKITHVIPISTAGDYSVNDVASIRVSWGDAEKSSELPPILEFGIVQAGSSFSLDSFTMTKEVSGDKFTNRGTLFLEPTTDTGNYSVTKSIPASGLLKSNDKTAYNSPYPVTCDTAAASEGADGGYLCSVDIELPPPVSGTRAEGNFVVILSNYDGVPYNLALCRSGGCEKTATVDGVTATVDNTVHMDMQLAIDSTGRANDLYRRVYTILQPAEQSGSVSTTVTGDGNPYYAVSAQNIKKIEYSTCEATIEFGGDPEKCEN